MDLEELLKAARAGESWAGLALVTQLMPMLVKYVEGFASDLSQSEQEMAVETAILRSVKSIDRYDPERASFPTWVRGTVRFAVLDIRRKKDGITEVPLTAVHLPTWLEAPPNLAPDGELSEGVTWSLLELSVTDQVIIALRDFEELSYSECAARIGGGVTAAACRVRHHRALGRLRDVLASDPNYKHLLENPRND